MSKARRSSVAFALVVFALLGSLTVFPLAAQFASPVGQDPSAAGVAALRDIIDTAYHPDLRWPDFSPYRSEVARFYASDGYSLAWIHRGQPRPQALVLIRFLQDADSKGHGGEFLRPSGARSEDPVEGRQAADQAQGLNLQVLLALPRMHLPGVLRSSTDFTPFSAKCVSSR